MTPTSDLRETARAHLEAGNATTAGILEWAADEIERLRAKAARAIDYCENVAQAPTTDAVARMLRD